VAWWRPSLPGSLWEEDVLCYPEFPVSLSDALRLTSTRWVGRLRQHRFLLQGAAHLSPGAFPLYVLGDGGPWDWEPGRQEGKRHA
jgi:hypothetical protein